MMPGVLAGHCVCSHWFLGLEFGWKYFFITFFFFSLYSRLSGKAIWPKKQVPSYLKSVVDFVPNACVGQNKPCLISQVPRKAFKGKVRPYRCEKMFHQVLGPTSGDLITGLFLYFVRNITPAQTLRPLLSSFYVWLASQIQIHRVASISRSWWLVR